jgi:hypothetical protein
MRLLHKSLFLRMAAAWASIFLVFAQLSAKAVTPSIIITNLPAFGAHGNMGGVVLNADSDANRVLAFIFVAGAWYSKPACTSQLTVIQPDGSWSANISPSANDVNATEIAAFLVPSSYSLPCVNGASGLTIPSSALAVTYANRVNPARRQFAFSDYDWWIKTSSGSLAGPGLNYFSDSTNNVWVDAQGALHLKIINISGQWQCAEIISDRSFGYGQYRFTVTAPVNTLDANAVLGFFTWSDDSAYNDREIDMELSRWSYAFGPSNVEDFAVAPYNSGQVQRFPLPAGMTNTSHSFIWQSNNIAFQTLNGVSASSPAPTNVLQSWTCAIGTPPPGGEQVHINLWLNHGSAPTNGQPVEVIISKFEFAPLGPPPPAQLGSLIGPPGGTVQLSGQGVVDWHYQILASSNLLDWLSIGTILATNNIFHFTDTNPAASKSRFYRALTDP